MARYIIELELDDTDTDVPGQLAASIVQSALHAALKDQDGYALDYLTRRYAGLEVTAKPEPRIENDPKTYRQQVADYLCEEEASDILATIQEYNNEVLKSLSADYLLDNIRNECTYSVKHSQLCDIIALAIVTIDRLPN